jgi:hypothetical protein
MMTDSEINYKLINDLDELDDSYQEEEGEFEVEEDQRKILWQAKDFSIREFFHLRPLK